MEDGKCKMDDESSKFIIPLAISSLVWVDKYKFNIQHLVDGSWLMV
jgi:hypothetical protein